MVVAILFFAANIAVNHVSSSELRKQVELARKAGIPLEPNDLRAKIDESENASPIIRKASRMGHDEFRVQIADFKRLFGNDHDLQIDLSRTDAVVRQLFPLTEIYRTASERRRLDFHRHWESGPTLLVTEYEDIKLGVRLLVARGDMRLRQGEIPEAFEDFQAAGRLTQLASQEPTVIASLEAVAGQSVIEAELERAIWRLGRRPDLFPKIEAVIQSFGQIEDMRHSLRGEIVLSRVALLTMGRGRYRDMFPSPAAPMTLTFGRYQFGRDLFDAYAIRYWRELWNSLPADPNDTRGAYLAMKQAERHLAHQQAWPYAYIKAASPTLSGAAQIISSELARRRVLLACAYLLSVGGTRPPAGAIDPFTGKALKVVSKSGRLVVYSVGPDGDDNGGTRRTYSNIDERYDIVAEYPHPPIPKSRTVGSLGWSRFQF